MNITGFNILKHDKLAKYLINNNISDEIKVRLDFRKLSAYHIWKALEKSNKRSDEERIGELKKELEAKSTTRTMTYQCIYLN